MKSKKILAVIIAAVMLLTCAGVVFAVADSTEKVVYVKDGGADTNDGTTAEKAVATMGQAYALLGADGGKIVVCGSYSITEHFVESAHTGTVTVTQVYGGTDYRTDGGAIKVSTGARWGLNGPTTFENLTFKNTNNKFLLIVAQYNKVVMGEGITCDGFTTTGLTNSVTVLGGCQNEFDKASVDNVSSLARDLDSDVTIKSGKFIVGGNSRYVKGDAFTGTSNITIDGGEVTTIYPGCVNSGNTTGECIVTINGGTISGKVYLGTNGASFASGNVTYNINGGTFTDAAQMIGANVTGTTVNNASIVGKSVVNILKTLTNAEAIMALCPTEATVNMVNAAETSAETTTTTEETTTTAAETTTTTAETTTTTAEETTAITSDTTTAAETTTAADTTTAAETTTAASTTAAETTAAADGSGAVTGSGATTTEATDNPSTGDMTVVFAAFAALSVAACASVVIAKKVKEN